MNSIDKIKDTGAFLGLVSFDLDLALDFDFVVGMGVSVVVAVAVVAVVVVVSVAAVYECVVGAVVEIKGVEDVVEDKEVGIVDDLLLLDFGFGFISISSWSISKEVSFFVSGFVGIVEVGMCDDVVVFGKVVSAVSFEGGCK